mgnify:FL=1
MLKLRNFITAAISAVLFMLVSCTPEPVGPSQQPEPEDDTPMLKVKTDPLAAPISGKTFILDVESNRDVNVVSTQEWCQATLMHNAQTSRFGSLKIVVKKTDEAEVRTAEVTLSAEGCDDAVITVTQDHRVFSSEKALNSLSIKKSKNPALKNDITFTFDPQTKTFSAMYLKWIDAEKPEMLKPTFEYVGASVLVGETQLKSETTAVSFAEDFTISVKAEDGSTVDYKVVFNCPQINTELPVLHMKPDQLINSKSTYVQTYIELYDKTPGSTGEGWWDSAEKGKIEMRGRGNSTWGLPKKPFRMKFTEKFSPIGLNHAKEKSWVLLAQDMDKSLLRNHLGFELSRILFSSSEKYHDEAALTFTPCSQMVNVYSGNDYHGVYQMSDQMEVAKGRIGLDKLVATDGSDPDKITGGHLIETNIHHDEPYPVSFTSSRGIYMDHKYPKDDDMDISQYKYIEDFIRKAEAALYSSNFTDPVNGWRKWFDEKTLADFIIVKEFAGDMDGYTSTYFYKRRGVDKIFFGPIWDLDKGWNNDKRTPHGNTLTQLMIYGGFYMPPYVNPDWFHRFWQDAEFRKFVGKRWASKKEQLKSKVFSELDEKPKQMRKAIAANFSVWNFYYQNSNEANMPARTYELEIQRMRDLTEKRAALLDAKFK